ncbi:ABC transporter substrate-binding protein [Mesorhizobium sp. CN2-181]|uniref:ABC transporter substrate-binding protein n=1 Tax=Mesorhizobium yinganensis TaxID=3157707 RepID=UPI0032B852CC
MTNRRDFLRLSGALAGVTLLPGLVEQAMAQDVKKGGHLVVSLVPEPPALVLQGTHPSHVIILNVSDGLVSYGEKGELIPQIASSWEQSDDGKQVTIHVREGVKWHDGTPLTAKDVKFSIEVAQKTNTISGPTLRSISSVEATDDNMVVLNFSTPSQAFWSVIDGAKTQIIPEHLYKDGDPLTNPYNIKPVGNGPFRFKEWVRGSHLTVERNPDYWDQGKPYLDEITFRFLPDAGARAIALQTGEAHYAPLLAIPLVEAKRIEASADSPLSIERSGWDSIAPIYFLNLNLEREFFKDVRVRKAIAHALDRKLLANNGFFGYAKPATGPIASYQERFYTPDTEQYDFNVEKAEQLLDEAGLSKDANGVRLSFDNMPIPYGEDYTRTAQLIQQLLKRVGIQVELKSYDVATYFRKLNVERDYDTASLYYSTFSDPQIGAAFRRYWSKAKETPAGGNSSAYVSAEADRLIEAALVEPNVEKRHQLIVELQKLAQTELPSISLLELEFFRVRSKRLEGINNGPFGAFASLASASFKD